MEVIASVLMVYGVYQLISEGTTLFALYGIELASLTLIFLLIGQRLAKDYAGAMSLTVYFMVTVFGIYLMV